jgi:hypothetical protein
VTIRKRRPWGESGVLVESGVVIHRDAEASHALAEARTAGEPLPMLGLLGGDLCATLGGTGSEANLYSPAARRYPVDLGVATADGVEHVFVAHVIVRRRAWRGRVVAAMNAQWFGTWDLGPKSHPNDGLLDTTDASLGWSDKFAARRRLATGTHVPHPRIVVRRAARATFDFEPAGLLFVDGELVGRVQHLELGVEPDAFTVVI